MKGVSKTFILIHPRTKAAYVHPKPANGDFTSASRRIYIGSFEVSSMLLEGVMCTFVRVLCASGSGFGGLIGGCLLVVGERSGGCGGKRCRLWQTKVGHPLPGAPHNVI